MRFAVAVTVAALAAALAGPAPAEEARAPYPEFTFRKVAPPSGATTRRITVQIDPEEQARMLAAEVFPGASRPPPVAADDQPPPPVVETGSHDWFWSIVPPGIGARAFETALAALDLAPEGQGVRSPRLQTLQEIARTHGREILEVTAGTAVSPALVLSVISVESAGRADAVSPAGAVGLMQLIPATAARFSVADSTDPAQNIRGGVAYLHWLMEEFDRDPLMVLAAYNSGENAVKSHGGVPPYAETRGYVPKVLAAWRVARGLCLTPPELVSDGCVFAAGRY